MSCVAVVGTGVVGAGWAALFLASGHDVVGHDPGEGAEARLRESVAQAWPALKRLGPTEGASPERLTFTGDLGEAVAGADFVQESGPERIDLKRNLFADLDAATPPDVVIASSSSGLTPSRLREMCGDAPERVLVGDHVRQELPGHVTNRLQAALWQEAYSLVERGAVNVADAAIAYGPSLRWALLGPLVNQNLSGGAGGMAHTLEHRGPPAEEWMKDLRPVPLTPALVALLMDGVDEELAGVDQTEMVAQRDELLMAPLQNKRGHRALP
ncbi:3-hydroxyacyl-CoA dehydrogenase NAD-binding domain-containing protein [Streptomyces sp. NPDC014892]|uniref:3-hydroxyacyl-CoA dehydrogenase NAD-binding domain-containing protein n=1 Tax=Streptomyces sp. NPDC014892 TaxID=3364930 RepID=UPI0036FC9389